MVYSAQAAAVEVISTLTFTLSASRTPIRVLTLMKHEILPEEEVAAILEDARDTLKKMPENTKKPELQAVMARFANSLAAGGNS